MKAGSSFVGRIKSEEGWHPPTRAGKDNGGAATCRREYPRGRAVMSDRLPAYSLLNNLGYHHKWVNHSKGECSRVEREKGKRKVIHVHTNSIEDFWGQLKNRISAKQGARAACHPLIIAGVL